MNLVLLGPPGVGKGTQAAMISKALNIPIISTGNLLRSAISAGTEVGKTAREYMDHGHLVPDDLIVNIVRQRLSEDDCKNGVILDGFPRNPYQAEILEGIAHISTALAIEVRDEVIEKRMSGRRTCVDCHSTFHIEDNRPKVEGVCDRCGGKLAIRHDDEATVVLNRLNVYHRETEPVKGYYANKQRLKIIDGEQNIRKVTADIASALGVSL